jgi:hypothetical protein
VGWKDREVAAITPRDEPKPERVKMTTFDEREKAFEQQFEHDMQLQFKARARKNKLLGLWAAGLMGKAGEAAEAYARDIVMADFEKPGDHDVVHTLMHDLAAAGKPTEEHTIRRQGERFLDEAKKQVMTEVKK